MVSLRFNQLSKLSQFQVKIKFPEKYKGTILEKWYKYWEGLFKDYAEVCRETVADAKVKPYKAASYFGLGTLFFTALSKNPSHMAYRDKVVDYQNLYGLVGQPIRNPSAGSYLKSLENFYNLGLIRRFSLGICSIIWLDNYDESLGLYKAQCDYLKPKYLTFHKRIIDIGFWNKFWFLERKMEDYDVNPNEWIDFSKTEYEYKNRIQ